MFCSLFTYKNSRRHPAHDGAPGSVLGAWTRDDPTSNAPTPSAAARPNGMGRRLKARVRAPGSIDGRRDTAKSYHASYSECSPERMRDGAEKSRTWGTIAAG